MFKRILCWLLVPVAFLTLLTSVSSYGKPNTKSIQLANEAALRELAIKYFAAIAKKDWQPLLTPFGLGSSTQDPPGTWDFRERVDALQRLLGEDKVARIKSMTINKIVFISAKADIHLKVNIDILDAGSGKTVTQFGIADRVLHCVQESSLVLAGIATPPGAYRLKNASPPGEKKHSNFGQVDEKVFWKLQRDAPDLDVLADAVISAKTENERKVLLTRETQRTIGDLEEVLKQRGVKLFKQNKHSEAFRYFRFVQQIVNEIKETAKFLKLEMYRSELKRYEKDLMRYMTSNNKAATAHCLNNIGLTHEKYGEYENAVEYLEKSFKQYDAMNGDGSYHNAVSEVLHNLAWACRLKGDDTKALEYYNRLLKLDDSPGSQALIAIGGIYRAKGDYARAIEYYQKSLKFGDIDGPIGTARKLHEIGDIHLQQGDYIQAVESFWQSFKQYEQEGDDEEALAELFAIDKAYKTVGKNETTIDEYRKRIEQLKTSKSRLGTALLFVTIGAFYAQQNNIELAIFHYEESIKQFPVPEDLSKYITLDLTIHLNLASVYTMQGKYTQAVRHYQELMQHVRKSSEEEATNRMKSVVDVMLGMVYTLQGDERLESYYLNGETMDFLLNINHQSVASILMHFGDIYSLQKNNDIALRCFETALQLSEETGDKLNLRWAIRNIGAAYEEQGNYERALDYYRKNLDIAEGIKSEKSVAHAVMSGKRTSSPEERSSASEELFQRGTKHFEEELDRDLTRIAEIYFKQANYQDAITYYNKILKHTEAINNTGTGDPEDRLVSSFLKEFSKVYLLKRIAEIYFLKGDSLQALQSAQMAYNIAKQAGIYQALPEILEISAKAYKAQNKPTLGRQALNEAIEEIEEMRSFVAGGDEQKQRFLEKRIAPYRAMVALMLAQGDITEALNYAERAKARVVSDALQQGETNQAKAITNDERTQQQKLHSELVALNSQIYSKRQHKVVNELRLTELNARRNKARLRYEAFQAILYTAYSAPQRDKREVRPVSAAETRTLLPGPESALLEFAVTEEKTYLFVLEKEEQTNLDTTVTGNKQQFSLSSPDWKVYTIDINQRDLINRIEQFRKLMANRVARFQERARDLYDILLKPAEEQLRGKTILVIVPDGPLWSLPFQALQPAEDRYLLEDCAISYAPSITALREMRDLTHLRAENSSSSLGNQDSRRESLNHRDVPLFLAIGSPVLQKAHEPRLSKAILDENLKPIPDAESQIKLLAKLYGERQSKTYIGRAATEKLMKSESGKYKILHFATHGIFEDSSPMYSHLVLSAPDPSYRAKRSSALPSVQDLSLDTVKEDGLLEAWEIMDLQLKADLVVLSACETARGQIGAGEGIIGLTWAFLLARCPTLVATQWKVESSSTTELMLEFHRNIKARMQNLKSGTGTAESLRQAALRLMQNSKYRHPFYWAGFVVVGDGW